MGNHTAPPPVSASAARRLMDANNQLVDDRARLTRDVELLLWLRAEALYALGHAHSALQDVLASSESEVAKLTEQRDRAVRDADRTAVISHQQWLVAQRLRGALAVALAQRDNHEQGMRDMQDRIDHYRGKAEAEVAATLTLLRQAAGEAVKHGDQDRAADLVSAAIEHEAEGCPVPLAECGAVRVAIEVLAEYRAGDAAERSVNEQFEADLGAAIRGSDR